MLEIINALIMNFLLDLMVREHPKIYKHTDFNLELNQEYDSIQNMREPTPVFQALIRKLREHKMSITRLYTFVEMLNDKIYEKEVENGVQIEKLENTFKKMKKMTEEN